MAKSKVRIHHSPGGAIAEIEKIARAMNGNDKVKVGLPKESTDYPDGTDLIMVAAVHEFGSMDGRVPQRSYLRSTVQEKRAKYKGVLKSLGKKIAMGELGEDAALKTLGLMVQGDVMDKIRTLSEPALAASTIKNRINGSSNPLMDTGRLRQSIQYQVGK